MYCQAPEPILPFGGPVDTFGFVVLIIVITFLTINLVRSMSKYNSLQDAVRRVVSLEQIAGLRRLSRLNLMLGFESIREALESREEADSRLISAFAALSLEELDLEEMRQALQTIFQARPDMEYEINRLVARMISLMNTVRDSNMVRDIMAKMADGDLSTHKSYSAWLTHTAEILARDFAVSCDDSDL